MNRLEHPEYEVYISEHNATVDDIALVFDDESLPTDKEYKKDFHYLEKLYNNHKADDILDAHTNGTRRFELFLDKKDNAYITGILEFIDEKLEIIIKSMYALKEMPKDRINDYIRKYKKLSSQEMKYENMRQKIIEYYEVE
jgi:hypothetical protein